VGMAARPWLPRGSSSGSISSGYCRRQRHQGLHVQQRRQLQQLKRNSARIPRQRDALQWRRASLMVGCLSMASASLIDGRMPFRLTQLQLQHQPLYPLQAASGGRSKGCRGSR
jgi:hypothetical protein